MDPYGSPYRILSDNPYNSLVSTREMRHADSPLSWVPTQPHNPSIYYPPEFHLMVKSYLSWSFVSLVSLPSFAYSFS